MSQPLRNLLLTAIGSASAGFSVTVNCATQGEIPDLLDRAAALARENYCQFTVDRSVGTLNFPGGGSVKFIVPFGCLVKTQGE